MKTESIRDREQLVKTVQAGEQLEYLYFWGHQPAPDGRITQSCFSQWFKSPFEVEGKVYPTAEHYMMSKKAELFGESQLASEILKASEPAKVKDLGRAVRNFDEVVWMAHRWQIVVNANFQKFIQNEPLKIYLLGTENRVIVEASPVDHIWGIGLDAKSPDAQRPENWKGLNLLGFALMETRERIRGINAVRNN